MSIIFTIIGLTILGIFVRAVAKDETIADKPKDSGSWIAQLIISLIVGAVVWAMIPKSCLRSSDYDPTDYQRLSRE